MRDFDALRLIQQFGADKIDVAACAQQCERDFAVFFQRSWHVYDPARYQHNWHIDAVADHCMALADGTIRKLLITLPPRSSKSKEVSVALPAWMWALKPNESHPLHGPQTTFMCLSYGAVRAKEDAVTCRKLIGSEWYQQRWGHRVKISKEFDNQERFDTVAQGSRVSTGIVGSVLGRGGLVKIIDDPMKPDEPESEQVRDSIIKEYDETLSSRENDPRIAAEIILAQRLGEGDLPGHVLSKYGADPDRGGFCHLMIPAEYDSQRHCVTVLGWQDPRGIYKDAAGDEQMLPDGIRKERDGVSFWPDRFPPSVLEQRKTAEGPFSWASKYQQSPAPRGGGIIKAEWWKLWPGDDFPDFRLVLVSVDTAQTEKEINDESGITVWGIFDALDWMTGVTPGQPCVMLVNAWEGRLEFHPLVTKIADMCKRTPKADVCLVEAKSNGIDVINELRRLYGRREWSTLPFDPKNRDKVARLTSVQAVFSGEHRLDPSTGQRDWFGGVVYAPDKDYAQMVIDRVAAFPTGKKKALVDTTSQAMIWLRENDHIQTREEFDEELAEQLLFKPRSRPQYDV